MCGCVASRQRDRDFWANQLRLLLTAAAYVLMQELRLNAAHTQPQVSHRACH